VYWEPSQACFWETGRRARKGENGVLKGERETNPLASPSRVQGDLTGKRGEIPVERRPKRRETGRDCRWHIRPMRTVLGGGKEKIQRQRAEGGGVYLQKLSVRAKLPQCTEVGWGNKAKKGTPSK